MLPSLPKGVCILARKLCLVITSRIHMCLLLMSLHPQKKIVTEKKNYYRKKQNNNIISRNMYTSLGSVLRALHTVRVFHAQRFSIMMNVKVLVISEWSLQGGTFNKQLVIGHASPSSRSTLRLQENTSSFQQRRPFWHVWVVCPATLFILISNGETLCVLLKVPLHQDNGQWLVVDSIMTCRLGSRGYLLYLDLQVVTCSDC